MRPDHIQLSDSCPCGSTLTLEAHKGYVQERHNRWLDDHAACRARLAVPNSADPDDDMSVPTKGPTGMCACEPKFQADRNRCTLAQFNDEQTCPCRCHHPRWASDRRWTSDDVSAGRICQEAGPGSLASCYLPLGHDLPHDNGEWTWDHKPFSLKTKAPDTTTGVVDITTEEAVHALRGWAYQAALEVMVPPLSLRSATTWANRVLDAVLPVVVRGLAGMNVASDSASPDLLANARDALTSIKDFAAKESPPAGDGTVANEEPWFTFWSIANAGLADSNVDARKDGA